MRQNDHPVAIVTGAAAGIGRAIAERFGRDGARIFLFDRDDAAVQETAQRLSDAGVEVGIAAGDVADLVAFIASPQCSFTTAAIFDISGGRATY